MNIIVCVKQVPDPEAPPASFKVDSSEQRISPSPNLPPCVSQFDEHAVEAALRICDAHKGKISILCMGNNLTMDVIKKPLAMGADELFVLQDDAFDEENDAFSTAYALSRGIEKIGTYDLILCGRQSTDWGEAQVGSVIAELLNLPCVTVAKNIEVLDNGRIRVERVVAEGIEVYEVPLPCVVTISNELGEPRHPNLRGIISANKKPVTTWNAHDIEADASQIGSAGMRMTLRRLFIPEHTKKGAQIIEGKDADDIAVKLVQKLKEDGVL